MNVLESKGKMMKLCKKIATLVVLVSLFMLNSVTYTVNESTKEKLISVLMTGESNEQIPKLIKQLKRDKAFLKDAFVMALTGNNTEAVKLFLESGISPNFTIERAGQDSFVPLISVSDYFKNELFLFCIPLNSEDKSLEYVTNVLNEKVDGPPVAKILKTRFAGDLITDAVIREAFEAKREFEIAKLLLEYGANPNAKTKNGDTAIITASSSNDVDIVRLLIKHKANVNVKSNKGETAITQALKGVIYELYEKTPGRMWITKDDLKEGMDLLYDMFVKNKDLVKLLLENTTSLKIRLQNAPIAQAVKTKYYASHYLSKLVKTIKKYVKQEEKAEFERHVSATLKKIDVVINEIIELLIKHKAGINARDKNGKTALMYAANIGDNALLRILLESGANPKIKDKKGKTILDYAHENQDYLLIGLLEQYSAA